MDLIPLACIIISLGHLLIDPSFVGAMAIVYVTLFLPNVAKIKHFLDLGYLATIFWFEKRRYLNHGRQSSVKLRHHAI